MTIHKEGYRTILYSFAILAILDICIMYLLSNPHTKIYTQTSYLILLTSGCLFAWIVSFFRYPNRIVNINDNNILCPADGKIVAIEEVEEKEYFHDRRIQISVFMSPFNVHANWYPVSGKVEFIKYHAGKHLVAYNPKSSFENEMTTLVINSSTSTSTSTSFSPPTPKILVRQIAGILARRIVYYSKQGSDVIQGDELGFIKFGSRVDLLLPLDCHIKVKINQLVRGKQTVIATM